MKKEIVYFFTALMFFTRIPCPSWVDHSAENLNRSRKYFPMVGWIVGAIAAGVLYVSSLLLPLSIAILLSMMASIGVTGAFHEDGLADVFDAFGGGWTKEQILTIMKDSRLGAYGAAALLLALLLKFFCLWEILKVFDIWSGLWILISAHALSRFVASTFVYTHDYVQDLDQSKAKPVASSRLGASELFVSFLFAILPCLMLPSYWYGLGIVAAYFSKTYLGRFFYRSIGGYTGDCLGATQQISEIVFYLSILGIWKFL